MICISEDSQGTNFDINKNTNFVLSILDQTIFKRQSLKPNVVPSIFPWRQVKNIAASKDWIP